MLRAGHHLRDIHAMHGEPGECTSLFTYFRVLCNVHVQPSIIYFGAFSIADRSLRHDYVRYGTEGPAKTTGTRAERPRATLGPQTLNLFDN